MKNGRYHVGVKQREFNTNLTTRYSKHTEWRRNVITQKIHFLNSFSEA
jgi:hypothetical protein